jgi:hypothetical protein
MPVERKYSPIGIASFIIGIVSLLSVCAFFALSLYTQNSSANSSLTSLVGFLVICTIVISLVGIGLGIGGVVQKAQSKVFSIIGLVLNALVLIGLCGLMVIGLAALSSLGL